MRLELGGRFIFVPRFTAPNRGTGRWREYFAGDRVPAAAVFRRYVNYELRPIIDKQLGAGYLDFNPTFDKSLHGLNAGRGGSFLRMLNQF